MAARLDELRIGACLADLKEMDYRNALAVASLVELLAEKGLVDLTELARKAADLDRAAEPRQRGAAR
jgi:hypothetical protein